MDGEELEVRLETLESHMACLAAVVEVLLENIAEGNAQDVASDIRAELLKPPTV